MNRFNRALRALFPTSEPTPTELADIQQAYRHGISSSSARSIWSRRVAVAVPAIAVLAIVGLVGLRPNAVQAALTEIANAARTVEPADVADDSFYFTESESTLTMTVQLENETRLVYTIDETRRVWISTDGQTAIIETTRHNPTFNSDTDRARYFDNGLDTVDQLNQTQTTAVEDTTHPAFEQDWPTNARDLLGAIRQLPNVNTDTQAASELLTLITESPAPPKLRAATIEALGRLDLTLVEETPAAVRLRTQPTDLDDQILEFTIDKLGQLRRYLVIHHDPLAQLDGEAVFDSRYSRTSQRDLLMPLPER